MEVKSAMGEEKMNQIVGQTQFLGQISRVRHLPSWKLEIIECLLESRNIDVNSYHVAAHNEEHLEDEADQGDEADNNQYNPPDEILDPTGYWRWNVESQQWIPNEERTEPILDPTGNFYWSYETQQWLSKVENGDEPENKDREMDEEGGHPLIETLLNL